MSNEIVVSESVQLGAVQASSPQNVIERAQMIAKPLADIIKQRKLYTNINGKNYVQVDGWTTLGAMLGITPREVESKPIDNGYEAYVELVRGTDGMVIGGASAICTREERNWKNRDDYALKSMAATRATGKAYRLCFSWIMNLAGYESTPAEEMIDAVVVEEKPKSRPKTVPVMSLEYAENVTGGSDNKRYGDCTNEELEGKRFGLVKILNSKESTPEQIEQAKLKLDAVNVILESRK